MSLLGLFAMAIVLSADWPMLGGSPQRNQVNRDEKNVPTAWDVQSKRNIKWSVPIGSLSYSTPVVSKGRVLVGTNNGHPRPGLEDKGVLLCLDANDGTVLWRAVHDKLPNGRESDWPEIGVTSTPCIDGDRVYYVSNRSELVCLDINGFANGNQGVQDEQARAPMDADVLWTLDFRKSLGVFPCCAAASSPVVYGGLVYVVTGNGVNRARFGPPPFPRAPSFIAVEKLTGRVAWTDASPGEDIVNGQWGSPSIIVVHNKPQVVFPGGDGWLRGFEPESGKLLWKFDCNPKAAVNLLGGAGTRNGVIAPISIAHGKVFVGVGQDPEHGEGVGHLWCIDPSKASEDNLDLSPVNDNFDPKAPVNRRSGLAWHHGGIARAPDGDANRLFGRTLSSCAVADGLCFVADLSGFVYCLDAASGKLYWVHDSRAAIWSSPLWVDDKVYIGDEDGKVTVLQANNKHNVIAEMEMDEAIYNSVVVANGVVYVKTKAKLFAIAGTERQDK